MAGPHPTTTTHPGDAATEQPSANNTVAQPAAAAPGSPSTSVQRSGSSIEDDLPTVLSRALLPLLSHVDVSCLRASCRFFRGIANRAVQTVVLNPASCAPPSSAGPRSRVGAWGASSSTSGALKHFPCAMGVHLEFSSAQEAKGATMYLLTMPPDEVSRVASLTVAAGPREAGTAGVAGPLSRYHHPQGGHPHAGSGGFYGGGHNGGHFAYNGGGASTYGAYGGHATSVSHHHHNHQSYGSADADEGEGADFTELLLSAACSCPSLHTLRIDKAKLRDTEAAAVTRMRGLTSLHVATNSMAQPLRRPLVSLMLGSLPQLRELHLSYIRDTTGDLAGLLPRLPQLAKLSLQYAYFGESGAGEQVAEALAKHHREVLRDLRLYECCVNDAMLATLVTLQGLTRLAIQDEDAPEESAPSNAGLAGITQLTALEHLELFGEELRLDHDLLASLQALPQLQHLAVSGLDSLVSSACAAADSDMDVDVELSGATGSGSVGSAASMDDVTSRPRIFARHAPVQWKPAAGELAGQHAAPTTTALKAVCSAAGGDGSSAVATLAALQKLTLYGPLSKRIYPPPLALLLPQPQLQCLKLSACANLENMQAVVQQGSTLRKLIVAHALVTELYPTGHPAVAEPQSQSPRMARQHSSQYGGASTSGGEYGYQHHHQHMPAEQQRSLSPRQWVPSLHSVLGLHTDVVALRHLRILRLKDVAGFGDVHLVHMVQALVMLPALCELKLRNLPLVSDEGIRSLAALQKLLLLKVYELSDVTEEGLVCVAADMPNLKDLKVKNCARVGWTLPGAVQARRGPHASTLAVRYGEQTAPAAAARKARANAASAVAPMPQAFLHMDHGWH